MADQIEIFLKNLEKLRELGQQGKGADPEKFDALAGDLLWDVKRNEPLRIPSEHLEFFKILATSKFAGEYWKGYGDAVTDFLLPLLRTNSVAAKPEELTSLGEKTIFASPPGEPPSQSTSEDFRMIMD